MIALTLPEIHEFLHSNESGWKVLPDGSLRKDSNEAVR